MTTTKRRFNPNEVDVRLPERLQQSVLPDLVSALHESVQESGTNFATEYLLSELFTKFVGKDTDPADVRRQRAIDKFRAVERHNERVNGQLYLHMLIDTQFSFTSYGRLVRRVQRIVRSIVGRVDEGVIFKSFSHTNGASTRVRRSVKAAVHKLSGDAHITISAIPYWLRIVGDPVRAHINASQTVYPRESSELFTVPKKSDIDRVACKEPEINMLLQRACGVYLRKRLKQVVGIDLRDQTVNQRKAERAYSDGFATIDLSSASDTISSLLVQQLLPTEWWALLDDLRVKSTIVKPAAGHFGPAEVHTLNLFSTMGNGFTFELESIIFYAITRAVCELSGFNSKGVSVYGDDIIAPKGVVPRLLRVLQLFGFKPNQKKTHYTGTFRESCGKHYDRGFDVTPFYIWRPIETLPDLIRLLNRVLEWDGRGWGFITSPAIAAFHWKYSCHIPRKFWGGVDPEDCSALVTGDLPRMRLVPRTKKLSSHDYSGMVHWLMSREFGHASDSLTYDLLDVQYLYRGVSEDGRKVVLDPREIVGFKASRCPAGWHTSWKPWLIYQGRTRM